MENRNSTSQLLILHLKADFSLIKKLWWQLIPTVLLLYYFGIIVGRISAYARYVPLPILKDLGFELFPQEDYRLESDIILGLEHFLIIIVCFASYIKTLTKGNIDENTVYIVNIWRRYLNVISIGHFLRICTYLSTSLPGPAEHCQINSENYNPPDHWTQIFYRIRGFGLPANCGDLIFSGHMLQMIVAMLCFNMYSEKVFTKKVSLYIKIFSWLLVPVQSFFIISSRQHYTVDIIVGIYVTVLLWITYTTKIQPNDLRISVSL